MLALLLVVLAAGAALWWLTRPLPLAAERVELSIEPGTLPRDVALAWVAAGVKTEPLLLYAWFRFSGQAQRIRAGSYEIGTGATPRETKYSAFVGAGFTAATSDALPGIAIGVGGKPGRV